MKPLDTLFSASGCVNGQSIYKYFLKDCEKLLGKRFNKRRFEDPHLRQSTFASCESSTNFEQDIIM